MKIMLHGATSYSNFGDYLFAEMFYAKLKELGADAVFYEHPQNGIGDFFSKHLGYKRSMKSEREQIDECDALVYISGGYFKTADSVLENFNRNKRYWKPALRFIKQKKPIYILGVGAGPINRSICGRNICKILNYADVVTVRNEESKDYCNGVNLKNDILVTADTALAVDEYYIDKSNTFDRTQSTRKTILVHMVAGNSTVKLIVDKIAKPIIDFCNKHPEYKLLLTPDSESCSKWKEEYLQAFQEATPEYIPYTDPWITYRVISQADIIVTPKLHVGIVGCTLGASVLSFPVDSQKTRRFYSQIGESKRCIPIKELDQEDVTKMLEKFKDSRIAITDELKKKAKMNLSYLDELIDDLHSKGIK